MITQGTADAVVLMRKSLGRLVHLRDVLAAGGSISDDIYEDEDALALLAVESWMRLDLARDGSARIVLWLNRIIPLIEANLRLNPRPRIRPLFICQGNEYARAAIRDARQILNYCNAFFINGPLCRRDVTIHERFHLVGLANHDPGTTPFGATQSVQSLVEIVRDAGDESDGNCGANR